MDELPAAFWEGVEQFNQQEFYACHDTLEALWMETLEPDRSFYQGILQIAVGLYHLSNHNWQGAVTLMGSGIGRLNRYCPAYGDINVTDFVSTSQNLLQYLQLHGPQVAATCAQALGLGLSQAGGDHAKLPDGLPSLPQITRQSATG
jgi:hypothetical protein